LVLKKNKFSSIAKEIGVKPLQIPNAEKFLRQVGAVIALPHSDPGGDLFISFSVLVRLVRDVSQQFSVWVSKKKFNQTGVLGLLQSEDAILSDATIRQYLSESHYPPDIHTLLIQFLLKADILIQIDESPDQNESRYFVSLLLPPSPLPILHCAPSFTPLLKNFLKGVKNVAELDWFSRYPEYISTLLCFFDSSKWDDTLGNTTASPRTPTSSQQAKSEKKGKATQPKTKELGRFYQFEYLFYGWFHRLMSKFLHSTEILILGAWQSGVVFSRGDSVGFIGLNIKLNQIVLHLKGTDAGKRGGEERRMRVVERRVERRIEENRGEDKGE
jgi:hypothetical protein